MGGLTQHERQTLGASVVAETLSAQGWNFSGIDHAVPGKIDLQTGRPETLFLVQGALDDPAHRRIGVNMEQALSQSIEQSSTVSQTVLQTREQAVTQEQQRAEQKDVDGPQGPTMRIGARNRHRRARRGMVVAATNRRPNTSLRRVLQSEMSPAGHPGDLIAHRHSSEVRLWRAVPTVSPW